MHRDRALWVLVGGFLLSCAAFTLYRLGPSGLPWLPGCTFHRITGLNCPGCGMTRAAYSTLHGRIGEAFRLNPLGMILLPLLGLGIGIELIGWVRGKALPFRMRIGAKGWWTFAGIVVVFWITRNLPWWPFTTLSPP